MKIYTKTGDDGTTMLFGGSRVAKHHVRIEAYGTVDELNSFIGLIRDQTSKEDTTYKTLESIQHLLFNIGSVLASDPSKDNLVVPDINEGDIEELEQGMDKMNETLPALKNFILPGGNTTSSYCHLARCVCRRAERRSTHLAEIQPDTVPVILIKYLNRLSDYLFVLGRKAVYDKGSEEIIWKSRK